MSEDFIRNHKNISERLYPTTNWEATYLRCKPSHLFLDGTVARMCHLHTRPQSRNDREDAQNLARWMIESLPTATLTAFCRFLSGSETQDSIANLLLLAGLTESEVLLWFGNQERDPVGEGQVYNPKQPLR